MLFEERSTNAACFSFNIGGKRVVPASDPYSYPTYFVTPSFATLITQPIIAQMTQKEGRIALAIQAVQKGQFAHLKTACRAYNVLYSTARDRVKGVPKRRVSTPNSRKLTDLEEQTLEQ